MYKNTLYFFEIVENKRFYVIKVSKKQILYR